MTCDLLVSWLHARLEGMGEEPTTAPPTPSLATDLNRTKVEQKNQPLTGSGAE